MTIKDKIKRYREMYIQKYGREPTSVILGYEVMSEIKRDMPERYVAPGALLYGMAVIMDNNKPTRVEAGDFET